MVKKRVASNGSRLPEPIRMGEIFTDLRNKQWKLGRSIGVGGFGEIYLASDDLSKPVGPDAQYVIKVEPHSNGPLFVEMNFYIRAAKPEMIEEWIRRQKPKRLGMPHYVGSGSHSYAGEKYRFLVQERFDEDLHQLFLRNGKRFHVKTALTLAIQIIDILEYIHSRGYIHSDIKASNLLLGRGAELKHQVYLLDYGLAYHYAESDGVHKEYRSDERRAHHGTVEYTSRDAHIGAGSRRGDLETLGYNLVQWLCGNLPWESNVESPAYVHEQKTALMGNVPLLMRLCSPAAEPPAVLARFLKYVASLSFHARPDYAHCKRLLTQGIKDAGFADNNRLEFSHEQPASRGPKPKKRSGKRQTYEEPENISPTKAVRMCSVAMQRQPCVAQNCNRMTRNSPVMPVLRSSHTFSWEEVLSSNPENLIKKQPQRKISPVPSPHPCTPPVAVAPSARGERIPTPAMLDVLANRNRPSPYHGSTKKSRDMASDCRESSLYPTPLNAEMRRVIRRREQLAEREVGYMTRSAKRRLNLCATSAGASCPVHHGAAKKKVSNHTRRR